MSNWIGPAGSRFTFGDWRINIPLLVAGSLILPAMYLVPWSVLLRLSLKDDRYTHILVVPFISCALIYSRRTRIFFNVTSCPIWGSALAAMGFLLCNLGRIIPQIRGGVYELSLSVCGGTIMLVAAFLVCFGADALRRAAFPIGFLLFMIPVPEPLMKPLIRALQDWSAAFCQVLFRLIGTPALRQDLRFSLPGFDIEIAEQCSGIRSSIALFIASTLAGHVFLQTGWRRLLLIVITIPLVVFKNAVRIVTISALGVYVSKGFLFGKLHLYSGLPFSLVELAIVVPILIHWQRVEAQRFPPQMKSGPSAQPAAGIQEK